MSDTLSSVYSFFYEDKTTQLGILSLDVLLQENLSLPSDVTKYPVEDGSEEISDHITRGNEELTINGDISAATSFGVEFASLATGVRCYSKLINAVDQLRKMHKDRKPVTVVTGLGQYEDMGFTGLTLQRQAGNLGGQWISINATLRKIKKVALKAADLPPDKAPGNGKVGTTERRAGQSGNSSTGPIDTGFYKATDPQTWTNVGKALTQ